MYIFKSATITVHIFIYDCYSFLYIILIYFFSPHILSLSLTLSLQPIIFVTNQCNPASPTTHRPTIANKPTTTTTQTQQNQPKIKQTHTRTHHKINQKSNTPTQWLTNRDREQHCCLLMAMGLCLEVDWNESQCLWRRSEFLGQFEQIFVDRCLWIDACECEGERERWFQPRGGEGEASVIHGGGGVFKDGEKERVFRWVLKGIWDR